MKKIGIFYGSSTGNTQMVAEKLAAKLNVSAEDVYDIGRTSIEKAIDYQYLILGSSTWGLGDVQDDWNVSELAKINLSGKKAAVFGTGDSASYSDTFCDALEALATAAQKGGAVLVGDGIDTSDYSFDASAAVINGSFCGLAIDEDNEPEKTAGRIEKWVKKLKTEFE